MGRKKKLRVRNPVCVPTKGGQQKINSIVLCATLLNDPSTNKARNTYVGHILRGNPENVSSDPNEYRNQGETHANPFPSFDRIKPKYSSNDIVNDDRNNEQYQT